MTAKSAKNHFRQNTACSHAVPGLSFTFTTQQQVMKVDVVTLAALAVAAGVVNAQSSNGQGVRTISKIDMRCSGQSCFLQSQELLLLFKHI